MWVYTDEQDRVIAVCPNDMAGNSGWQQADVQLTTEDPLQDDHGAALYLLRNGTLITRTEQARMADWPPDPEPSEADQLAEAARIMFGEVE